MFDEALAAAWAGNCQCREPAPDAACNPLSARKLAGEAA